MTLAIDDDISNDIEKICGYLTNKLYNDPEFYGQIDRENIVEIKEF